ncbi:MAG: Skp family chaperone for outer membrane protein [Sulfitobacter sp.]|jgi:Skp family chaperone for outer membrane proteins
MKAPAACCFAVVLALVGATPALAQQQQPAPLDLGAVSSSILTIDSDRVFQESAFGRRVADEVEQQAKELAAEFRKIEAELETKERKLTDLRPTMAAEEFRVLADQFDADVQRTRQEQSVKERNLNELLGQEREVFLTAAAPVLEKLMLQSGATVILERRSVFYSANAIEITDEAIALLDETLGSGIEPKQP